jgi:hypothetical protein
MNHDSHVPVPIPFWKAARVRGTDGEPRSTRYGKASNLFEPAECANVRRKFAGIAQLVEQLICNLKMTFCRL